MKTKYEEYQKKIVARFFLERKREKLIDMGIWACLIIAIIVDINGRTQDDSDHLCNAFLVMGVSSTIVYCGITLFFFFYPSFVLKHDVEKKKENFKEEIKKLEEKINDYGDIINDKSRMIDPEYIYLAEIDRLQEQIWKLEFEIKLLE